MSQVQVFEGIGVVCVGDLVAVLWREPARVHRNRWLFDQMDAAIAANPGGIVGIQLILPTSSPPDAPARAENNARLRKIGTGIRRFVTVPLGDALWLSLVRTIMRALALVAGQSKVLFVGDTEAQGLDLVLAAASKATPTRQQVIAAFDDLYAALDVPRPKTVTA